MRKIYLILSLAFLFLLGCENHLEMTLPEGPQGEQGPQGEDGLSAFDLWKIFYQKGPNATFEDFMNSLKGKDGKDGAVPIIGENGNWHINGIDTNIPARGKDGEDGKDGVDGVTPEIGSNGNWWIDGVDTGIRAEGRDGYTPEIGYNGNWWINGSDTGFPAIGKDGKDGVDGITPQIGHNGNWWIDGQDTGVPVTGKDGKPGIDGITPTIGSNGNWYIDDCDTGVPARGQDGKDGKDGVTPNIGANGNWYIDGDDTGVPAKGVDGVTPQIGGNGNWYINGADTGVPARGKDGKDGVDGVTPHIGGNGNWYINGQDTGVPAKGITPIIGGNGNWYIDGRDTGVSAEGKDGEDGKDGVDGVTPHIGGNGNWYVGSNDTGVPAKGVTPFVGGNGNWYIDGVDTGVPATGADGIDGATPQIGESGNWVIDGCDTGVPVTGNDGKDGIDGVSCDITIGSNGNWWIDGKDTGKTAVGKDGEDGEDGVAPVIVIGWNGNWFIDGVDSGVPAQGKDGKDGIDGVNGVSPTVGKNGNWYIGDCDTGVPAKGADGVNGVDGATPEIGSNGNWWINGKDSGIPAQGKDGADGNDGADGSDGQDGKDGVDGKTSYELWKEAVDKGEMTNKDGSEYTGGNSWEAFLKWLQGGDVSVLHQYWLSQGNTGDLQAFIEALFDCHCDGITTIVFAPNDCLNLDINNNIAAIPDATLTVGAEVGAKVQITGDGVTTQDKTVAVGASEVKFTIPRTAEDQFVLITVTLPGGETSDQVTKSARIPALKYIELESATIEKIDGEEKDIVTITFKEEPIELYINGTLVYDSVNGVKNNWEVSDDKKTFTKTYTRAASPYPITVKGIGDDNGCSIFTNLLEVPQLSPVEVDDKIEIDVGECEATLTLRGTKGMTVTAKTSFNNETIIMDEGPDGVYTVKVPRRFTQYSVAISAAKAGAGTVNKNVQIDGLALLPTPFTYKFTTANSLDPVVKGVFTNPNSKNIEITFSRNLRNTGSGNPRLPWTDGADVVGDTKTVTVPANASVTLEFLKNVADDFSSGRYTLSFETTSFCGLPFKNTYSVQNQTDFSHGFRKIGDEGANDGSGYPGDGGGMGGSNPYDPDYDVPTLNPGEESTHTIFEVSITDAIPNSYAQFLLNTKDGFRSIWGGSKKVDENGHIRILVKMHNDDIAIANGGIGEIKLSKAKTSTEFFHTKELVNVQLPE